MTDSTANEQHEALQQLKTRIDQAMLRDRHALRRELTALDKSPSGERQRQRLTRLQRRLEQSVKRCEQRRAALPSLSYDTELPIFAKRQEIITALQQHQVLIVAGETGSGKSTQLPKICLEAGLGIAGMVGHTQPRRIAARSVAARVASELGVAMGQEIGFKIRFTDSTSPRTLIKLMTDGILLAETQTDRFLEQYEVIILDEAHERSLNIDFLIGFLTQLLPRRPDLRLIITSATIDAERFAEHFAGPQGPAPIIQVSGRTYPVEVRYQPLEGDEEDQEPDVFAGIVAAVRQLAAERRGDTLVFLPTERDIREAAKRLRAQRLPGDGVRQTEILPLYARLSVAEQNRIFQTGDYRRIVLATNVAESSLTVPGIHNVIDTGTARISRYSPRLKVQRLPIEAISRASADQRAGRCGRIGPGVCIRLYAEEDYLNRDQYTTPEIRRTNLAAVILQAQMLRLGDVAQIPFLDPPRSDAIRDGYKTLFEIGAVDTHRQLTPLGRRLAQLPVDPRVGRLILAAADAGCLAEILIIASALEVQDPRDRPLEKQQAADQQHEKFRHEDSDFLAYLKLWDFYHELKDRLSRSKLRKACQQNFLSYNRLREWADIHRQLRQIVTASGMTLQRRKDDYAAIHTALLTGLLSGVAFRSGEYEYTGAGGVKFHLWPGSGLFEKRPKWILAAELVETGRRFGRTVARIQPEWIEPLAQHLVKRSYSDPHWSSRQGAAMAYEKVSLFGLPIVARRRVRYTNIDPDVSRQLFIQHGLVEEQIKIADAFFTHNRQVREEIARLADKTRNRAYVLDDYSIYSFYELRLPADVADLADLRRWVRRHDPAPLFMQIADLVPEAGQDAADQFPDQLNIGSLHLPVQYHFTPGDPLDGVTITVPAAGLGQLDEQALGWLVPGLLEEKIIALIRSLPKAIRRSLVPAPDTARKVAAEMEFGKGPFLQAVARHLGQIAGEPIPLDAFRLEKLPEHLTMNIQVVDEQGTPQAASRDLAELRSHVHRDQPEEALTVEDQEWHRDQITNWDFGEFPEQVRVHRGGIELATYPALIDQQDSVSLRLLSSADRAARLTQGGLTRLYALHQKKSLRSQVRWLPRWDEIAVWGASLVPADQLRQQVQDRIAQLAFVDGQPFPRNEEAFQARLANAGERIGMATQAIASWLPQLFENYHRVRLAREAVPCSRSPRACEDIDRQLAALTSGRFLAEVPWKWLQHYPRYLAAIEQRCEKLRTGNSRLDEEALEQLAPFWERWQQRQQENEAQGVFEPELEEFRWMIEEFRVSLFAQQLGTAQKISAKRLEKQWAKL